MRYDDFIDGWRITVSEIKDIDRVVEQKASRLVIHWLAADNGEFNSGLLQSVLEPFRPGRCNVSLYYQSGEAQARLQLGGEWNVRPSGELRERLAETIGVHAFKFGYEKRAGG